MEQKSINFEVVYPVSERFYSLQGEGVYCGRAAFFIRLAGCRVGCPWCDSKSSWTASQAEMITVEALVKEAKDCGTYIVVITGGEPMMHNLDALTNALKDNGLRVHLETSGSEPFSGIFDWITLSPKKKILPMEQYYAKVDELKVVIESEEDLALAEMYAAKTVAGCALLLQSEWSSKGEMMPKIVSYIKQNNKWGLSQQTHKYIGIE